MAINQIEVSTSRMNSDISGLENRLGQTRTHIEQMRSRMERLDSMWDGEASEVMKLRFQMDHEELLNLCQVLESLIDELERISQAYDTCENNVYSAVQALNV